MWTGTITALLYMCLATLENLVCRSALAEAAGRMGFCLGRNDEAPGVQSVGGGENRRPRGPEAVVLLDITQAGCRSLKVLGCFVFFPALYFGAESRVASDESCLIKAAVFI